jgi:hypothetical protein
LDEGHIVNPILVFYYTAENEESRKYDNTCVTGNTSRGLSMSQFLGYNLFVRVNSELKCQHFGKKYLKQMLVQTALMLVQFVNIIIFRSRNELLIPQLIISGVRKKRHSINDHCDNVLRDLYFSRFSAKKLKGSLFVVQLEE